MKALRRSALIVTISNLQTIFVTWLHSSPNRLPDKYMFVFFVTEYTQDLEKCEGSFEHVPNVICAQQMCSKYEAIQDMNIDCEQCGKHVHVV